MLKEKINEDLKQALKDREKLEISTLRLLLSAIHNQEIEKRAGLSDDEVIKVLAGEKKKHQDSIEQFSTGNRPDLVEKEKAELAIITAYLPAALTEDELSRLIAEAIKESGASRAADFGKVMKLVMASTNGRADGGMVSQMVKAALNKT